jgi:hypothetical protein
LLNAAIGINPLSLKQIYSLFHTRIFTNTLRTTLGCTEAVIDDDGGLKRFYQIADILTDDLQASFVDKEDDFDNISWAFQLGHHQLTLHYSIYNGISVFPTKTKDARKRDNLAVVELANVLEGKLMSIDMKKHIA